MILHHKGSNPSRSGSLRADQNDTNLGDEEWESGLQFNRDAVILRDGEKAAQAGSAGCDVEFGLNQPELHLFLGNSVHASTSA